MLLFFDTLLCPVITTLLLCPLCYKTPLRAVYFHDAHFLSCSLLKPFQWGLTLTLPKLFLKRSLLTFSLPSPIVSSWFSSLLIYKQPLIQRVTLLDTLSSFGFQSCALSWLYFPLLGYFFTSSFADSFSSALPPGLSPGSSSVLYPPSL